MTTVANASSSSNTTSKTPILDSLNIDISNNNTQSLKNLLRELLFVLNGSNTSKTGNNAVELENWNGTKQLVVVCPPRQAKTEKIFCKNLRLSKLIEKAFPSQEEKTWLCNYLQSNYPQALIQKKPQTIHLDVYHSAACMALCKLSNNQFAKLRQFFNTFAQGAIHLEFRPDQFRLLEQEESEESESLPAEPTATHATATAEVVARRPPELHKTNRKKPATKGSVHSKFLEKQQPTTYMRYGQNSRVQRLIQEVADKSKRQTKRLLESGMTLKEERDAAKKKKKETSNDSEQEEESAEKNDELNHPIHNTNDFSWS